MALLLRAAVLGHGSMIMPVSRGGIDAVLPEYNHTFPPTGVIEPYTCRCVNGSEWCASGQGCFWFSQGCNVGCDECTGNGSRLPNFDQCPHRRKGPPGEMEGALDPMYRTTNLAATPGSVEDIWKFNPWRAPGKAPVFDSCGMAGGNTFEVFNAGAYRTTRFAKQGDLGSRVLPKRPTGTVWPRGERVKARWELTAAHGGGYSYRLCALGQTLEEACFEKNPVPFATAEDGSYNHTVIDNTDGPYRTIAGTVVASGGGKGWALFPQGYGSHAPCDWNPGRDGLHCHWRCPRCGAPWWSADGACPDYNCSHHNLPRLPTNYGDNFPGSVPKAKTIEDTLVVPPVAPGEYVLQWRWDCEATSQIWTS